jgi:hypothetical protein
MRLYSRTGAASVEHQGHTYEPGEDGGYDFPEAVGRDLHSFHVAGKPMWETDIERQNRLMNEELERRKDPATLLEAVEQIVAAAKGSSEEKAEHKPAVRRRPAGSGK